MTIIRPRSISFLDLVVQGSALGEVFCTAAGCVVSLMGGFPFAIVNVQPG
jgi:hypothetical protein